MLLFCLLGVILVIGGLTLRRTLGTILSDTRLALFGARVRVPVPTRRATVVRSDLPPPHLGDVPPPRVVTRPRR
jgi:hypothetical protein